MIDLALLHQPVLGERCKEIREKAGVTVSELSEKIGVSRMAIYNFEKGKTQSLEIFRVYYKLSKGVES